MIFLYIIYIVLLTCNYTFAVQEGHKNSLYFPSKTPFDYSSISDIIGFGDSYSHLSTDFTTLKYSGRTTSGGNIWLQSLQELHNVTIWPLCMSGAPIDNEYIKKPHTFPFTKQCVFFKLKMTKGKQFDNWKSESTLFTIWFGINDIFKTKLSQEETVKVSIEHMYNTTHTLYNYGAKNILFINIPPTDKFPWAVELNNKEYLKEFTDKFNKGYEEMITKFSKNHEDANIFLYNSFDEFNYIIENYKELGIDDIKNYCNKVLCYPEKLTMFWYDYVHPTPIVHKYLANDLHFFLSNNSVNRISEKENVSNLNLTSDSNIYNKKNYYYFSLILILLYIIILIYFYKRK